MLSLNYVYFFFWFYKFFVIVVSARISSANDADFWKIFVSKQNFMMEFIS